MLVVERSIRAAAYVFVLLAMTIAQAANAADYLSLQGVSVAGSSIPPAYAAFNCPVGEATPEALFSAVGTTISEASPVSPKWQIDFARRAARNSNGSTQAPAAFDAGAIVGDYQLTGAAAAALLSSPTAPGTDRIAASDGGIGIRLNNGWSLGLTYETIDSSIREAPTAGRSSIGPVYEGPLFVATVKF